MVPTSEEGGLLGIRPRAILRREVAVGQGGVLDKIRTRIDELRANRPKLLK